MMTKMMRKPSLEAIGLGNVLGIFERGALPIRADELVDRMFGKKSERGSFVVSGAGGIVGAGKCVQMSSRLLPHGVPVVGIDLAGAPDGLGAKVDGMIRSFGRDKAHDVMSNIVRITYDGKRLPAHLGHFKPRMLLEAIPEILPLKRAHFDMFRAAYPGIEIRSVTSGFPSAELGVGIAHPAFPHEINKIWECVEGPEAPFAKLAWALGMIPLPVADQWSFVLDVLFCGLTKAAARYNETSNMPAWKVDKHVRRLLGPNPLRAHDAIGPKGACFLTWTCLHHLAEKYGAVFAPPANLAERKDSGETWFPPNHFRPIVDWTLSGAELADLEAQIVGPVIQMASIMIAEKRASLSDMNAVGELCAQFRRGIVAVIRGLGHDKAVALVERFHALQPECKAGFERGAFEAMGSPEWQQLYVNAEHNGKVGVISVSREAYNWDVDAELNRAIDWLKVEGIERVIVSSDFHLSTQMVGADILDFAPGLKDEAAGAKVAESWTRTARRLHTDFETSVAFVNGKRLLGGCLELMTHCHFLVATPEVSLGFPEVTLPVVPGMEGCHWPFRKAKQADWPKIASLLVTGKPVAAAEAVGWLVDFAGPTEEALKVAYKLASGGCGIERRPVAEGKLDKISSVAVPELAQNAPASVAAARRAIWDAVLASCGATAGEALSLQARVAAGFMAGPLCNKGKVGAEIGKALKA
jgi:enoyl-CoA hydratase/carnithine racemase